MVLFSKMAGLPFNLYHQWIYQLPPNCRSPQLPLFFFKIYLFILFMAVLDLCFCARAFSSCGKRGPLFIAVHEPLTIAASLVVEHRLQTRRLSNCGSWAQLLCGMWDLPRPGLEPVSPALAGRFSTTAPPGKPPQFLTVMNKVVLSIHDNFCVNMSSYFCEINVHEYNCWVVW